MLLDEPRWPPLPKHLRIWRAREHFSSGMIDRRTAALNPGV